MNVMEQLTISENSEFITNNMHAITSDFLPNHHKYKVNSRGLDDEAPMYGLVWLTPNITQHCGPLISTSNYTHIHPKCGLEVSLQTPPSTP